MVRRIDELEREIKQLSPEQLKEFRIWYEQFDSDAWDKQIEVNARNGALDDIASRALAEHRAGNSKPM